MDFLKRSLAPITEEAWLEINETARNVLRGALTGRKISYVTPPKGWGCDSVSEGTLTLAEESPVEGVNYGIRDVLPLVELRVPFTLSMWDLDDISRGSKITDFSSLEEAARAAALFEDTAVFHGIEEAGILGIEQEADNDPINLVLDDASILDAVFRATEVLAERSVEGPYVLVASKDLWTKIITSNATFPLRESLKRFVDHTVISTQYDTNFVCSMRGDDSEIVIGQDMSIGYQSHTSTDVNFYFTETFTFRVNVPEAFVPLVVAK